MSDKFSEKVGGSSAPVNPPVAKNIPNNPQAAMVMAQQDPGLAELIKQHYEMEFRKSQLEMAKLQRDEANFEQAREAALEANRTKILESENERQNRLRRQADCDHRQSGILQGTNVRGQRAGNRQVIAHCQRCAKIWHEQPEGGYLDELGAWMPGHLQPKSHHIGGFSN
jgi:hypothetical protein